MLLGGGEEASSRCRHAHDWGYGLAKRRRGGWCPLWVASPPCWVASRGAAGVFWAGVASGGQPSAKITGYIYCGGYAYVAHSCARGNVVTNDLRRRATIAD